MAYECKLLFGIFHRTERSIPVIRFHFFMQLHAVVIVMSLVETIMASSTRSAKQQHIINVICQIKATFRITRKIVRKPKPISLSIFLFAGDKTSAATRQTIGVLRLPSVGRLVLVITQLVLPLVSSISTERILDGVHHLSTLFSPPTVTI